MSKTYITVIVLVLVVGGALFLFNNKKLEGPVKTTQTVKEFTVTGQNYSFTPNIITVKKGDKVRIIFKNDNGFHNLIIDEFNIATKTIQGGSQDTIEFIADKVGSFQYYCSVGSHRAQGMWGTLEVIK